METVFQVGCDCGCGLRFSGKSPLSRSHFCPNPSPITNSEVHPSSFVQKLLKADHPLTSYYILAKAAPERDRKEGQNGLLSGFTLYKILSLGNLDPLLLGQRCHNVDDDIAHHAARIKERLHEAAPTHAPRI